MCKGEALLELLFGDEMALELLIEAIGKDFVTVINGHDLFPDLILIDRAGANHQPGIEGLVVFTELADEGEGKAVVHGIVMIKAAVVVFVEGDDHVLVVEEAETHAFDVQITAIHQSDKGIRKTAKDRFQVAEGLGRADGHLDALPFAIRSGEVKGAKSTNRVRHGRYPVSLVNGTSEELTVARAPHHWLALARIAHRFRNETGEESG